MLVTFVGHLILFAKTTIITLQIFTNKLCIKSAAEKANIRLRRQPYGEEHAKDPEEGKYYSSAWQQYSIRVRVMPGHQVKYNIGDYSSGQRNNRSMAAIA